MLENKSHLEADLQKNQDFIANLEREIKELERDKENLHRKIHMNYNSFLQSTQRLPQGETSKQNMSSTFQKVGTGSGYKSNQSFYN